MRKFNSYLFNRLKFQEIAALVRGNKNEDPYDPVRSEISDFYENMDAIKAMTNKLQRKLAPNSLKINIEEVTKDSNND